VIGAIRATVAAATAAVMLAGWVSPAAGSVTVGQVAPGVITSCSKNFDFLQVSTPDNSYVTPAGTITSWTHRSQVGAGQQVTLKVFRKIGDPARYQVVGHDGPNPVTPSTLKTFPANLAVKAGDVLGLTGAGGTVSIGCEFSGAGEAGFLSGPLADGGFGDFNVSTDVRINVSAVVDPTNSFTVGGVTRNKKKGTATISVTVPNPGDLTGTGAGATISKAAQAGTVQLLIKAKGKKRKTLNSTGKVKLSPTITYTPTGGDPSSQSVKVKLRKK
jgi:hypothetical protein